MGERIEKFLCFLGFHKWFEGQNGLPKYCIHCHTTLPYGYEFELEDDTVHLEDYDEELLTCW
jgi:hypothetical protein